MSLGTLLIAWTLGALILIAVDEECRERRGLGLRDYLAVLAFWFCLGVVLGIARHEHSFRRVIIEKVKLLP